MADFDNESAGKPASFPVGPPTHRVTSNLPTVTGPPMAAVAEPPRVIGSPPPNGAAAVPDGYAYAIAGRGVAGGAPLAAAVPPRNLALVPGEVEVARYHQKMACDCDQFASQTILLTTHRIAIESVTRLAPCIRAWTHEESFFYSDIQQVAVARETKTGLLIASIVMFWIAVIFFIACAASPLYAIPGVLFLLIAAAIFVYWCWRITMTGYNIQMNIGREALIASWNWRNMRDPFAKQVRVIELDRDEAFECAYRIMTHPRCNLSKMFPNASA